MRFAFAFLSTAFAALAIAVATGAFTGLDQWAVDHVMPGGRFGAGEPSAWKSLIPFGTTDWGSAWSIVSNVVALPASFLIALVLVAWRSRLLTVVLVAAVAVEALCKEILTRPGLDHGAHHVVAFDDSFPSGHALRTVIVAGAFASPWTTAWAVAAIVLIQLAGWHTPSDIAGGVLLGLLALLGARALRGRRLARRGPR